MKKQMLFREMYKAVMIIIAFIGIVIQADSAYPFERSEEKKDVIINGITLSASQVSEIQNIYKIEPMPGNDWYDRKSGLNGLEYSSEKDEVRSEKSEVRKKNYEFRISNFEQDTAMTNNQLSIKKSVWQW